MNRKSAFVISILVTIVFLTLFHSVWAYEEIEITDGGTISGIVKFVGSAPKLEPIKVLKDQDTCGDAVPTEVLIINPQNQGLKNAVIYLEQVEKGKKVAMDEVVLDNTKCQFAPHVLVVPKKIKLPVKNSDPILHNTHSFLGEGTVFNLALPLQGQVLEREIKKSGVIRVQCDAHVHMSAWILALEHPYFAVTDENGNFKITTVPPGNYKIIAWHEPWKPGEVDKGGRLHYEPESGVTVASDITVPAKGEVQVSFEFSSKEEEKKEKKE
jgi:hypothetical protein